MPNIQNAFLLYDAFSLNTITIVADDVQKRRRFLGGLKLL